MIDQTDQEFFATLSENQQRIIQRIFGDQDVTSWFNSGEPCLTKVTLRFPEGIMIEMRRIIHYIDMRPIGEQGWRGTLLKSKRDVMEWVVEARVQLVESVQ